MSAHFVFCLVISHSSKALTTGHNPRNLRLIHRPPHLQPSSSLQHPPLNVPSREKYRRGRWIETLLLLLLLLLLVSFLLPLFFLLLFFAFFSVIVAMSA